MWFMTGLPERRIGMFARMHHAIADGIAGVATLGAFLEATPEATTAPPRPWAPAPAPPARALFADNIRRHAASASGLARAAAKAPHGREARPGMRGLLSAPPTPGTSLDRVVGPDRMLAMIRGNLDLARQAAHRHGAKVNDVLLAVTAAGLRALFRSRGESVEDVRLPVYVPVTLRQLQGRDQARGNLVGQMVVPLPLDVPDPGLLLERIAVASATEKSSSHPDLGTMLQNRFARSALLKFLERHPVSVTTADVPGPARPAYFAGSRVLEVFPVLPLIARVTLGVGALSYAGQLNITVVADRDAVPDLDVFVAAARDQLQAICAPDSGR
jgi:diacylglycerol O-acyltransferase